MLPRSGLVLVSALVSACHAAAPVQEPTSVAEASPAAASDPVALAPTASFDWSPPCRVPVVERSERAGHSGVLSYVVELAPAAEGELALRLIEFDALEVDGHDLLRPEYASVRARLASAASAMPTLRISSAGDYLGVTDLQPMIDLVIAQSNPDPAEARRMREFMTAPRALALLERKMGDYWSSWVGMWRGWDLSMRPGEFEEGEQAIPTNSDGGEVIAHVRRERRPDTARGVVLRFSSDLGGDDARTVVESVTSELRPDLGGSLEFRSIRKRVVLEVETDPATLRPWRTYREETIEVVTTDGESRTRREVRDVAWDWTRATGCGR